MGFFPYRPRISGNPPKKLSVSREAFVFQVRSGDDRSHPAAAVDLPLGP